MFSLIHRCSAGIVPAGAVMLMLSANASAAPQPRPRLWLNNATITRLQAARAANTPEWQDLKSWCDSRLGANLREGYQYLDWYSYVHNYGLMYQVTGDVRYGNEGVSELWFEIST